MAEEVQNPAHSMHFDEEKLMLFIDGELAPAEAELVRSHLLVCAECRQRNSDLEAASLDLQQFQQSFAKQLPVPPGNWAGFEHQIRAALRQPVAEKQPWRSRLSGRVRSFFSGPLLPWALSGAAAALAMVFFLAHQPTKHSLSVNDVLTSSEQASVASEGGGSAVVYQKIRITDSSAPQRPVTLQLWSNRKQGRYREVVMDSPSAGAVRGSRIRQANPALGVQEQLLRDLHGVYDANQLPQNAVLSPAAFRQWTQNAGHGQESIREDRLASGEKVYRLSARASGPASSAAADSPFLRTMELLVRASDWHAVAERLTTSSRAGERTFEIAELEYRIASPSELPEGLLTASGGGREPMPDVGRQALPEERPSQIDLAVDALGRLDRADALVQDQIVVARGAAGGVEIHGIVRNEARRAEILAALGGLAADPAVRLNLFSAANAQPAGAAPLTHPIQMQSIEVQLNQSGSVSEVRNYLAAHRGVPEHELEQAADRFVTDAVEHSTAAQLNAQALKNIIAVGPTPEMSFVSPATRERWRALVIRHSQMSLREVQLLEQQLAPVFSPRNVTEATNPGQAEGLPATADLLLNHTTESDRILWQAFSSNANATDRNGLTDAKFWMMLKEECALAKQLTERVHP